MSNLISTVQTAFSRYGILYQVCISLHLGLKWWNLLIHLVQNCRTICVKMICPLQMLLD